MNQTVEERFAKKMKEWNRRSNSSKWVCLVAFYLFLCGDCVIMDWVTKVEGKMETAINAFIVIIFFCTAAELFAYTVCWLNVFTKVDGKEGRMHQFLVDCVYAMPFSMEAYYSVIKRKLKKIGYVITISVMLILSAGMFIDWEIKGASEGIRLVIVIPSGMKSWLTFLLIVTAGVTVAMVIIWGTFRLHKKITFSFLTEKKEGVERKPKKQNSKMKGKSGRFSAGGAIIYGISVVAWEMGCLVLLRGRLEVSDGTECYMSVMSGAFLGSMAVVCIFSIVEEIRKYRAGDSMRKSVIAGYIVLLLLSSLYYQTDYDRYFADRIEVSRPFVHKEYGWDEVQSYTVKKRWLNDDIQLELHMEDRTLRVLRGEGYGSDRYYDLYESHYSYVAELVKRLNEVGIDGTIEDIVKLEEMASKEVENWDKNALNAVKEIEKLAVEAED